MNNNKPFVQQLLTLANNNLNSSEKQILAFIIEEVLTGLEAGHSCLNVNTLNLTSITHQANLNEVLNILEKSNLVGYYNIAERNLDIKPLTLMQIAPTKNILYITRYFYYELEIARKLTELKLDSTIDRDLIKNLLLNLKNKSSNGFPNAQQLNAINTSILNKLSIITGGPGTGKTTTVVILLWALVQLYEKRNLKIQICAPTGKAAARIKESIYSNFQLLSAFLGLDIELLQQNLNHTTYGTIHKLLNYKVNNIYFYHNKDNPFDVDILIIDEASMIGLPLFYKLLSAIDSKQISHIIFLGDKNQLSSVEEGYVFASLIRNYTVDTANQNIATELLISNRSTEEISKFAENILYSRIDAIFNNLTSATRIILNEPDLTSILTTLFSHNGINIISYLDYIKVDNTFSNELLQMFNQLAILCLTRVGTLGSNNLNKQIESLVKKYLETNSFWYTGRPVIILENDYNLGLHNGNIGICVIKHNKALILFEDGREFIPELLPKHELAYAITIHKSQGSEFDNVIIVIPEDKQEDSNIKTMLSKELLYTAVTRAKKMIAIYSQESTLTTILNSNTERQTGLDYLLT